MIDTTTFKTQNVPKNLNRSRLAPYLDAIIDLRESGFTLEQVQTFLRGNNIETSTPNITMYLARYKTKAAAKQPIATLLISSRTTLNAQIASAPTPELGDVFDSSFNSAEFMKKNTNKRANIGKKII